MSELKSYWKKLKYWQRLCVVGFSIIIISFLLRYTTNALGWNWFYRAEGGLLFALFIIIVGLIILKIKNKNFAK